MICNVNNYAQIYLDFDGVISDSNHIKEVNILRASSFFVSEEKALNFTRFFIKNNGIPREQKTLDYFKDEALSDKILRKYAELNSKLLEAPLTFGVLEFLKQWTNKQLIILSGGNNKEIVAYLEVNKIRHHFSDILCGPETKEENLQSMIIKMPAIFIGDSCHDYNVAQKFSIDFIFMSDYTQLKEWETFCFENKITTIKNLNQLV
jgi:phosphoglycolate phosphatase-like HAD superfamily hydrolase